MVQSGFQALLKTGLSWASSNSPTQLRPQTGLKPFEYDEAPAPLPNYIIERRVGYAAEPIRTMQKPLDPTNRCIIWSPCPKFEVNLFAADPEITKPIWLTWDERGRLWIAETVDYPNEMQPPGQGRDRMKICEDTDDDGRADKFIVFADQLSIPTSFVFANGGVIVSPLRKNRVLARTRKATTRPMFAKCFLPAGAWGHACRHEQPALWVR